MSPPPESSTDPCSPALPKPPAEFSAEERALLLELARHAISSTLQGEQFSPKPPSAHLAEYRAVFTTVYVEGGLRGCVGYALPTSPLYMAVVETARSAAFHDPRFSPITRAELAQMEISLSVLSPLFPIQPEEVQIGLHGLLISFGGHRGLLLPQVPCEHGWDRITFLEQTCRKAGLPKNAWRVGASIQAFTAEIFSSGAHL
jgi:uncharacterized protein